MAGTSRMNREVHVRFCGGLEVKFLRSTWLFTDFDNHRIKTYGKLSLPTATIKMTSNLHRIDASIKFLDLIIQFGIYTSENISNFHPNHCLKT